MGEPALLEDWLANDAVERALRSRLAYRVFNTVSEFWNTSVTQVSRMLRDTNSHQGPLLKQLVEAGLLARFGGHYYLSRRGMHRAARFERVSPQRLERRLLNFIDDDGYTRRRNRKHDSAAIDLAIGFMRAGVPVFNGWRALITIPGWPQVSPDLIVRVGGPFGSDWYRVEYEQSATGPAAIRRKLRPYATMARNGRRLPFLVVCNLKRAEETSWQEGRGLPMLTTTLEESKAGPLVGESTVW